MQAIAPSSKHFVVPTAQDKALLIANLRGKYQDHSYEQLKDDVKTNLQALATRRGFIAREMVSRFFHIALPDSMQEAIGILAMKKTRSLVLVK